MIPILLYHSVPWQARRGEGLAVQRERFRSHLDAIVASGRPCLTISEIAAVLRGEQPPPDRAMAITFDDGYADTPEAIELLCDRGLRASVFVTTGHLGGVTMITRRALKRLAVQTHAVEIGAHSVTHPHLDELSSAEIDREVSTSKQQLEQVLGGPVRSFAYPYGSYDRRVRHSVISAGYESAAAVKNAVSHRGDDPWAIARWTVRARTDAREITRVLEGRGAPRAWEHERLRTRGYRSVRRLRRRLKQAAGA
jgi:peptidoglycan/xylan/chitin deacetylase (PgdA/CDA1 family)